MRDKLTAKQSLFILASIFVLFCTVFAFLVIQLPAISSIPKKIIFKQPFSLIDHNGGIVTEKSFTGKASVIFFGFTSCPEICPTTLSDLSFWLDELGRPLDELTGYFVSVDPERDKVKFLNDYIDNFSERILGVTGRPNELEVLYQALGVYVKKIPQGKFNYTIDHTSAIYLLDAQSRLIDVISYEESSEIALAKLKKLVK